MADITVTWPTAFVDANYTVIASILEDSTSGLIITRVRVKTASQIVVRVQNTDALVAHTGVVHAMGVHD